MLILVSQNSNTANVGSAGSLTCVQARNCFVSFRFVSQIRAWLNGNAMFYETFICFCVSEAKPLCFSLCSRMFDDVGRY